MRSSLVRARDAAKGGRVKKGDRYDVSMLREAQFEPGSRRRVLRNLLGIRSVREMNVVETRTLQSAMDQFNRQFDADHRFTADDICGMHRVWLEGIYEWAGEYRSVNVSKDGFPFAAAGRIPALTSDLQKNVLARRTPCRFSGRKSSRPLSSGASPRPDG